MDKKLLVIFALFAFFVFYIVPVLIAGLIISGIILGIYEIYKRYPKAFSHVISVILTPLLIIGWFYMGYVLYSNNYCNTYKIRLFNTDYNDNFETKEKGSYSIIAKSEKEVYVKVWRNFILENKKNIKTMDDFYHYGGIIVIWNQSKNKQCFPVRYEKIDSLIEAEKLYYRMGELKLDLLHLASDR